MVAALQLLMCRDVQPLLQCGDLVGACRRLWIVTCAARSEPHWYCDPADVSAVEACLQQMEQLWHALLCSSDKRLGLVATSTAHTLSRRELLESLAAFGSEVLAWSEAAAGKQVYRLVPPFFATLSTSSSTNSAASSTLSSASAPPSSSVS